MSRGLADGEHLIERVKSAKAFFRRVQVSTFAHSAAVAVSAPTAASDSSSRRPW